MLNNIQLILPAVILGGGAFVLFVIARLCKLSNKQEALCAVLLLVISLVVMVLGLDDVQRMINDPDSFFGVASAGGIRYYPNAIGVFVLMVGIIVGIMVILYSGEYLSKDPRYMLYYPLILLILAGLMGMFMSANLFNLFLLVEFITVTASALIAFRFYQEIAIKAGFKYLIMSSIGTMFMLLGVYYVFRSTGTMDIDLVFISADPFTKIGGASFLLGFSLKAGVVPLHTWVPDVYGHAPSAVSGLLAGVISKSMLFMMPLICLKLGIQSKELGAYLMIFACLNMLIGSIRMLRQVLLRRFLSFSTIAQTGYLMFAMGIGLYYDLDQAITASLYLFLVIAVMKSLAFLSAGIFEFHLGSQNINQVSGVGLVLPFPALCFSISLAGLAGIPLLAGFNGKWLVFTAAFATNDVFALSILVIFLASSVIGLGGYLPIIVKQYYRSTHSMIDLDQFPKQFKVSNWILIPVSILTILVIGIGIYPTPWITLIEKIMVWMKV